MKELFFKNRRLTIRETAGMVRISFGSVQSILKDSLKVLHIAAKFMSGQLIEEQKENLINMCQNVQENTERDQELPCDLPLFPYFKVTFKIQKVNIIMIQVILQEVFAEYHICTLLNSLNGDMIAGLSV